jgi:hypothetical protein
MQFSSYAKKNGKVRQKLSRGLEGLALNFHSFTADASRPCNLSGCFLPNIETAPAKQIFRRLADRQYRLQFETTLPALGRPIDSPSHALSLLLCLNASKTLKALPKLVPLVYLRTNNRSCPCQSNSFQEPIIPWRSNSNADPEPSHVSALFINTRVTHSAVLEKHEKRKADGEEARKEIGRHIYLLAKFLVLSFRISERGFVIQPLEDLIEKDSDHFGVLEKRVRLLAEEKTVDMTHEFEQLLDNVKEALHSLKDPSRRKLVRSMANIDDANRRFRLLSEGMPGGLERVFPLNGKLRNPAEGTLIMGILNVTPDR